MIGAWIAGEAAVGRGTEVAVAVVIGKGIEETGIGKERKKTREVEDEIEIMIRREAMTEKGTGRDRESALRSKEVGVRERRRSTKKTRRIDDTEMTKKSPRKNTAEVEAERGNTEVGAEAEMQGSGAGAGARTSQANIKTKAKRSQTKEAGVAVKEELVVLRRENESTALAGRSLESAAGAKTVPTRETMVTDRTSQTGRIVREARVESQRAKKRNRKTKMRLCEDSVTLDHIESFKC